MANIKLIRRINHIVQFLRMRKEKGASFEEIVNYIQEKDDTLLTKRTFQRDKEDIEEAFDIKIAYNRDRNIYYIAENETDAEENIFDNLLLVEAYRECKNREDIMIFEQRKPRGLYHLDGLIYAIRNKKIISFEYTSFWNGTKSRKSVKPFVLKEFEHRWYLLGKEYSPGKETEMKIFGLDRMTDLEISATSFKRENFNAHELFANSYGIVLPHEEPQEIVLSFDAQQGKYIKTLPLHHSQKVLSETDTETLISVFLVPTYDFWQKILSFGWRVRVVSPSSFAEIIRNEHLKAVEKYQHFSS